MRVIRNNLAFVLLAIFVAILIFFMLRLQSIIISTQQPTSTPVVSTLAVSTPVATEQQPTVLVLPTETAVTTIEQVGAADTNGSDGDDSTTADPQLSPTATTGSYQLYGSTVIGAIHIGSIDDRGFNQANDEGLRQMIEQVANIRLISAENIPETEAVVPVIEDMIERGAKIIFTQSFGYLPYALEAAEQHPDVIFMNAGGFELGTNVGTYLANHVEAMYLTGMAAGAATQTGELGFISAFPMGSSLASVNAFQLGARSVNPNVRTRIVNIGSWVDPSKERQATEALATVGVDVVAMIVDSPITIVETAKERNIYVIGFHSGALQELAPDNWLTGVEHTWGNFFITVIEQVRSGQWQSGHARGGIESDMFRLAPFGPAVSEEMQAQIRQARADIISGRLHVFAGPIVDNLGITRVSAGSVGELTLLDNTDWLIEGVSDFDATSVLIAPLPTPPTQANATSDVTSNAIAPEEERAEETVAVSTPTPASTADVVLGTTGHYAECTFVTEVVAQIMRDEFAITVEMVDFATDVEMYRAMADREDPRRIDLTLCYGDPTDRRFLREHFGFVTNIGDAYWQGPAYRLQILANISFAATAEQTQTCIYQFLRTIHFDELDITTQTPVEWVTNNTTLIAELTSCN